MPRIRCELCKKGVSTVLNPIPFLIFDKKQSVLYKLLIWNKYGILGRTGRDERIYVRERPDVEIYGMQADFIIACPSLLFSASTLGNDQNSNESATRTASSGPWSGLKVLSTDPVSKDSFNTQHDFVIPITGSETTTYLYVGDRYSQHHGRGIGRNIFLPLVWEEGVPKLKWYSAWKIDTSTGSYEPKQQWQ